MPKILHVITGLELGGAEGVLARLVCAADPEFEHVVISLKDQGHFGPILRQAGITVHEARIGSGRNAVSGLAWLVRVMRREKPALVQTWLYHADLLGGLAARLAGIGAVIWSIRNTNLDAAAISRSTHIVAWISARVSRVIPSIIICNSAVSRRVHIDFGYRAAGWELIPNGYDLQRFRPDDELRRATRMRLGFTPDDLVVGCVARWNVQKDHANLLRALQLVAAHWPSMRLVLAGPGMDRTNGPLLELVQATGLESCTELIGPCSDVPALMNALDLHILASMGEAFPNVVAEAMACGTPCVVTDVGDAARIVGDAGWVVARQDSPALANAIGTALTVLKTMPRTDIGSRCRVRVVENFDIARMVDSYGVLWRHLCGSAA